MCGRYYRRSDKQRIGDAFNIADLPSSLILSEDYNVAPTTFQPVIRNDKETGDHELVLMRWGLVPFFTKQLSDVKGISTINARREGIEKSRTWRTPFQKRRCLVPADGYYEWAHLDNKTKKPYAFKMRDDAPFAFAGLWDAWKDPTGEWLQSYSLITTEANELASIVIDRMPVILHPKDYDRWLERESERPPLDLLRPFESEQMVKWACNPLVGSVKNNGPEMLNRHQQSRPTANVISAICWICRLYGNLAVAVNECFGDFARIESTTLVNDAYRDRSHQVLGRTLLL